MLSLQLPWTVRVKYLSDLGSRHVFLGLGYIAVYHNFGLKFKRHTLQSARCSHQYCDRHPSTLSSDASTCIDSFLNRFSYVFQAGARFVSLQNIDAQFSPMTTTPFASPEARYLAAPLKPSSPLSVRTVRTTLPAPEPPIAHHSVEEPSSSPLSSIEYVSDDDREDTSNAANDYPGDVSKTAQYRSPRILPFELYQHCLVYFEEQLCTEVYL